MDNSEGIQVEYIAIFLAVVFPGALVAFEFELLQNLPQFTALLIYCAGIWHNAVHHSKNKKCFVCNQPTLGMFNTAHEIKKKIASEGK